MFILCRWLVAILIVAHQLVSISVDLRLNLLVGEPKFEKESFSVINHVKLFLLAHSCTHRAKCLHNSRTITQLT